MRQISTLILILSSICAFSQAGTPSTTFGNYGKITTAVINGYSDGRAIAVQADGKIIVGGNATPSLYSDFALVRYNVDGSLDNSFDGDGKVITAVGSGQDYIAALAIQNDGKIIAVGMSQNSNEDFALVRYNVDGSLDNSFDGDGKVTTDFGGTAERAQSVTIQSDGKIIVSGFRTVGPTRDFALVRYNMDGSLDNSFDGDGKVTTAIGNNAGALSIVLQNDGKIIAAGYAINSNEDFALVRYNMDGSLDNSFDGDGKVTTDFGSADAGFSVGVDANGKIVVGGYSGNPNVEDIAIARYYPNGTLDNTFDGDGRVTTSVSSGTDLAYSIALQNDGKIVAGGYCTNGASDFALVRYNNNGSLDITFDGDGKATLDFGGDDLCFAMKLSGFQFYMAGRSGGEFALAVILNDATPLPLSLTTLTAAKKNGIIELKWATAFEANTSHFEIHRSNDGKNFISIGRVTASGNSLTEKRYAFSDVDPLQQISYYKLKMIDRDERSNYSKVIALELTADGHNLKAHPNPVKDVVQLQTSLEGQLTISVFNAIGSKVKHLQISGNSASTFVPLDLSSLKAGIYQLQVKSNEKTEIIRIVKQ